MKTEGENVNDLNGYWHTVDIQSLNLNCLRRHCYAHLHSATWASVKSVLPWRILSTIMLSWKLHFYIKQPLLKIFYFSCHLTSFIHSLEILGQSLISEIFGGIVLFYFFKLFTINFTRLQYNANLRVLWGYTHLFSLAPESYII